MTLENSEVLENLREQIVKVNEQYEQLATTRLKLIGAIDVLDQIEESKKEDEPPETGTVEVVDNEESE